LNFNRLSSAEIRVKGLASRGRGAIQKLTAVHPEAIHSK